MPRGSIYVHGLTQRLFSSQTNHYGVPFVSKFFLKNYGSGTNQMGGFVGGAPFLQMADSWTWRILWFYICLSGVEDQI